MISKELWYWWFPTTCQPTSAHVNLDVVMPLSFRLSAVSKALLPRQAACSVKFEFSTVPVCWSPCHHTAIQYCTPTVEDTPPRHVPRCSNRCFFRQHWQKDAVRSCTAVGRTMTARREPHNATTATNDCCGCSNSTPWSNVEEGLGIGSRSLPRWLNRSSLLLLIWRAWYTAMLRSNTILHVLKQSLSIPSGWYRYASISSVR